MGLNIGITSLDIMFGGLACLLFLRVITARTRSITKGLRLPPGPSRKPIIGNVTDIPKAGPLWEAFDTWAKEYGPLVYINLLGQSIVVVNSLDIAHDLFEKRSSIYSDRVDLPMVADLMGWDWNIAVMRYGDWWRRHRKMLYPFFQSDAVVAYEDIQTRQTRDFLERLSDSPSDFMYHLRHFTGATIMEVTYGIKVLPKGDPYIETAEAAAAAASEASVPGRFFVNIIPFLKHVPEWVPGAGFQRKAREWAIPIRAMAEVPFLAVKKALASGTAVPSLAATLLEDLSHNTDAPADEEMIIWNVTGVAYAAGADTTVSTLATFILAMLLYPGVQKKAQAELDGVVLDRLPTLQDRDSLPYVTAVCKEIHRWHPAFPLGIGHRVIRDDIYGEYLIPAGAIVIGNVWTMLRDEQKYGPNPEVFDPERFLRPGAIDPIGHFGFGRRICVGRYFADNSIFIAVASILKVFSIRPARDEDGVEIPARPAYSMGLLTQPEPFRCTIEPRSESTKALLVMSD